MTNRIPPPLSKDTTMNVRLHDLTLPELQSLSRQYGGPVTYKRTELFAFLLDYFDINNQKDTNANQP